ncbi:MAG: hypothetical protein JXR60_11480, partial [Bacteroidales bacterium]|nr:hypothetical protein [Bacteroidales bacterium]
HKKLCSIRQRYNLNWSKAEINEVQAIHNCLKSSIISPLVMLNTSKIQFESNSQPELLLERI